MNEPWGKQGGHEIQKYNDICKVHRTTLGTYKWLLSDGKFTDNHRVLWGRWDNAEWINCFMIKKEEENK